MFSSLTVQTESTLEAGEQELANFERLLKVIFTVMKSVLHNLNDGPVDRNITGSSLKTIQSLTFL